MRSSPHLLLPIALALLTSATAGAQPRVPSEPATPLPADARAVADAIPSEQTPAQHQHYVVSNEQRFDLVAPLLDARGGALVGVGTDQNYTMAAMAHSSLVFIVDYDAVVQLVHEMYGVLVPASDTPAALIARFEESAVVETEALLTRSLSASPHATSVLTTYRANRARFLRYLRRLERHANGPAASWIADPTRYAYVRELFRGGRIVARTGDLTGEQTMRAVAAACRRLEVPMRVVYLSNAEQFFAYGSSFKANLHAMPVDARSVVVRTARHPRLPNAARDNWHFIVEDATDFDARLATGAYPRSFAIVGDLIAAGPDAIGRTGVSVITSAIPRAAVVHRADIVARGGHRPAHGRAEP